MISFHFTLTFSTPFFFNEVYQEIKYREHPQCLPSVANSRQMSQLSNGLAISTLCTILMFRGAGSGLPALDALLAPISTATFVPGGVENGRRWLETSYVTVGRAEQGLSIGIGATLASGPDCPTWAPKICTSKIAVVDPRKPHMGS